MRRVGLLVAVVVSGCLSTPDRPGGDLAAAPPRVVVAGRHHACAVEDGGAVYCWGDNRFGQLGIESVATPYTGVPTQIAGEWTTVAAGRAHTCAIDGADGSVVCWGANEHGQCGASPSATAPPTHIDISPLDANASPVVVVAGGDASCLLDNKGHIYCWGAYEPQTGDVHALTRIEPGGGGEHRWYDVSLAESHACARDEAGRLLCWGSNTRRAVGPDNADDVDVAHAYQIPNRTIAHVATGLNSTLAIDTDGKLIAWGWDQLPAAADMRSGWTGIVAGRTHACGLRDADLFCWGENDRGQLGNGYVEQNTPGASAVLSGVAVAFAGDRFTCARDPAHGVKCWGSNQFGEAGIGTVTSVHAPVAVVQGPVSAIVAGDRHTCALVDDGTILCWGDNRAKQVAAGNAAPYVLTPAPSGVTWSHPAPYPNQRMLAAGLSHTCARTDNYGIKCWGSNSTNQLGPANVEIAASAIGGTGEWVDLNAGGDSTCAHTSGGNQYCWGEITGATGALVSLPTVPAYFAVGIGDRFAVGARDETGDTTVDQWGTQHLDCATSTSDAPWPAMANAPTSAPREVSASLGGDGHACAIDYDTTASATKLYCWGNNSQHQVSTSADTCIANPGTNANSAVVTLPSSLRVMWRASSRTLQPMVLAGNHTCVLGESPQDLYCWGDNSNGALGINNDLVDVVPSPKLALPHDATLAWEAVAGSTRHTCAIGTDRKVYCWGLNQYGEVGTGDRFPDVPATVALPR